jgi:hypothetical protein
MNMGTLGLYGNVLVLLRVCGFCAWWLCLEKLEPLKAMHKGKVRQQVEHMWYFWKGTNSSSMVTEIFSRLGSSLKTYTHMLHEDKEFNHVNDKCYFILYKLHQDVHLHPLQCYLQSVVVEFDLQSCRNAQLHQLYTGFSILLFCTVWD